MYSFSRPRRLALLDGDDAVLADLVHHLGDDLADLGVGGADGRDGRDLLVVSTGCALRLDRRDDRLGGLVDAALHVHRVGAGGDDPEALGDDRLAEHDRGGRAVAGDVVGLGRGFLEELRAHVLERIVELDVARDGHAVIGDGGRAELLVQHDVAALGAERHLEKKFGSPTITNDGVTIARDIELDDPFENMGAQLVKEIASKTNDIAGDGAATRSCSVRRWCRRPKGRRRRQPDGHEARHREGGRAVVGRSRRTLGSTREQIGRGRHLRSDHEIGEIIAEVMVKVGKDGVITVEESKSLGLEKEYTEGMQFDRGYISAYFVTNPDRMEAVLENAFILITDKKISSIQDMLPALEKAVQPASPC